MAAIGRILLMPKGTYSSAVLYNALDWVRYNGAAWVCTTDYTTNITPSLLTPEWQLLAEDGSVGGWTSLQNKPFETIGTGLSVNGSDELVNDLGDVEITSPQDGQILEYDYTNSKWVNGDKISTIARYGGTKTFAQLTSSLLVVGNVDKFYLCTDGGSIQAADAANWLLPVGSVIPAKSHIAVIEDPYNPGSYIFDDFGGYIDISGKADKTELDEFTAAVTQNGTTVTFDDLDASYGYKLCWDDSSASGDLAIPKWTNLNKSAGTNSGIKLVYTIKGGTSGNSQFKLRILK